MRFTNDNDDDDDDDVLPDVPAVLFLGKVPPSSLG